MYLKNGDIQPEQQYSVLMSSSDCEELKMVARELAPLVMVHDLNSPEEARELLDKTRPDLIILEFNWPGSAVLDLCAELRLDERYQWAPIFFLSSEADPDKKLEGYAAGADLFITRPFHPKELSALVQAAINRLKGLRANAIRDHLTGIFSRKYFMERLDEEVHHYQRKGKPFTVVMIDLDWFKLVNDQLGHMSGDYVLAFFSTFLRKHLRHTDVLARYGGEEFVLLMPDTETSTARAILERLSESWLSTPLVEPYYQKKLTVTFSAGAAEFGSNIFNAHDLILAADKALYAAKDAGRNRTFSIDQLNELPEIQTPMILVVDDSSLIRHLLEKQLSEKGYRVATAGDGHEALELTKEIQPCLALVDLVMPGMDGLELTRKLRENPKTMSIKVIALTADHLEETLLEAFHAGVDDYMNKPFSFPELEARIQRLLKKKFLEKGLISPRPDDRLSQE